MTLLVVPITQPTHQHQHYHNSAWTTYRRPSVDDKDEQDADVEENDLDENDDDREHHIFESGFLDRLGRHHTSERGDAKKRNDEERRRKKQQKTKKKSDVIRQTQSHDSLLLLDLCLDPKRQAEDEKERQPPRATGRFVTGNPQSLTMTADAEGTGDFEQKRAASVRMPGAGGTVHHGGHGGSMRSLRGALSFSGSQQGRQDSKESTSSSTASVTNGSTARKPPLMTSSSTCSASTSPASPPKPSTRKIAQLAGSTQDLIGFCMENARSDLVPRILDRLVHRRGDFAAFFLALKADQRQEFARDLGAYIAEVAAHLNCSEKIRETSFYFGVAQVARRCWGFKADYFAALAQEMTTECVFLDRATHQPTEAMAAWTEVLELMFSNVRDGYYQQMRWLRRMATGFGNGRGGGGNNAVPSNGNVTTGSCSTAPSGSASLDDESQGCSATNTSPTSNIDGASSSRRSLSASRGSLADPPPPAPQPHQHRQQQVAL